MGVSIPSDCRHSKGIELLGSIWYQSKAKIKNIFEGDYAETSSSRLYAGELPQEIVEMIIAHVLLDTPTLKACSLTCRSWNIATLPHLHHTHTLRQITSDPARRGDKSLQELGKMRLLPLVVRLRIDSSWSVAQLRVINALSPAYFSTFTNVQELSIRSLDFYGFAPQMELYFGHLAPKLRSLTLDSPWGTRRDLLSFIGLFPNLHNFELRHNRTDERLPGVSRVSPVPQSAPSMRGCLTLKSFGGGSFLRDLSELCGGLRFHSVDLVREEGVHILLDVCAETLETLRISPYDWTGMGHSQSSWFPFYRRLQTKIWPIEMQVASIYRVHCGGDDKTFPFYFKLSRGSVAHHHVVRVLRGRHRIRRQRHPGFIPMWTIQCSAGYV